MCRNIEVEVEPDFRVRPSKLGYWYILYVVLLVSLICVEYANMQDMRSFTTESLSATVLEDGVIQIEWEKEIDAYIQKQKQLDSELQTYCETYGKTIIGVDTYVDITKQQTLCDVLLVSTDGSTEIWRSRWGNGQLEGEEVIRR